MSSEVPALSITVIMPVFNGAAFIAESLPPLIAMRDAGAIAEVIVVDDVSTDETAALAARLGARVMTMAKRAGPGAARNQAAREARGDILWLVDADVVAHADAAAHVRAAFTDPQVVAAFGSYDDHPPARNFASQYKNMVHHFYHQKGAREASTFWSGCGAVRRDAFVAAGGFDIALFDRPSVEDIELGYRLREAGGRILLIPEMQATHLKVWTFSDMIRTDVLRRAIPWARLMLARGGLTDDLNVSQGERARAILAGFFLVSLLGALATLLPWWAPLLLFSLAIAANGRLFGFFHRRKGLFFALGALLYHQLYYLYSAAAFAYCWLEARLARPAKAAAKG
ncbi:MAG: glycosyltransferase [Pseudomonadota bacterium]